MHLASCEHLLPSKFAWPASTRQPEGKGNPRSLEFFDNPFNSACSTTRPAQRGARFLLQRDGQALKPVISFNGLQSGDRVGQKAVQIVVVSIQRMPGDGKPPFRLARGQRPICSQCRLAKASRGGDEGQFAVQTLLHSLDQARARHQRGPHGWNLQLCLRESTLLDGHPSFRMTMVSGYQYIMSQTGCQREGDLVIVRKLVGLDRYHKG